MLVMPTGTGKTFVAAMIAATAKRDLGCRTLFLCNREILVRQAESTLSSHGLEVLVEMAGEKAYKNRIVSSPDVVIATVQTMQKKRLVEHWPSDYFGLLIQDECHHANSKSHRAVYNHFPEALHLGITATPGGGKLLGNIYQTKCHEYKIRDAIRDGWLSPIRLRRIPIAIDLKGISTIGGDFNDGELAERISNSIEELASGIQAYIGDRYAVVFCPDVGCALAVAQALSGLGVESRYVAGSGGRWGQHKDERKAILKAFNGCRFQVIVCCDLLFEGWDCPHISAVVNLRPTYKLYRFQQMAGRGTRPCEESGKEDLLVLDFDWQTHRRYRDLAYTGDLFSGELEERVQKRIRKKIEQKISRGEEVDLEFETEAAKAYFLKQDKMCIRISGRKLRLVADEVTYDPIGVGKLIGTKLVKRYDIDTGRAGNATENQLYALKGLGVVNQGPISKWGATKLISRLKKRKEGGLATPEQLNRLSKIGVNEGVAQIMSEKEATEYLGKALSQKEMFG